MACCLLDAAGPAGPCCRWRWLQLTSLIKVRHVVLIAADVLLLHVLNLRGQAQTQGRPAAAQVGAAAELAGVMQEKCCCCCCCCYHCWSC